jgi:hypothetical protein
MTAQPPDYAVDTETPEGRLLWLWLARAGDVKRIEVLEEARARDAEKIDALHHAVSALLDRAAAEPREDRFAAAAGRFRERVARAEV